MCITVVVVVVFVQCKKITEQYLSDSHASSDSVFLVDFCYMYHCQVLNVVSQASLQQSKTIYVYSLSPSIRGWNSHDEITWSHQIHVVMCKKFVEKKRHHYHLAKQCGGTPNFGKMVECAHALILLLWRCYFHFNSRAPFTRSTTFRLVCKAYICMRCHFSPRCNDLISFGPYIEIRYPSSKVFFYLCGDLFLIIISCFSLLIPLPWLAQSSFSMCPRFQSISFFLISFAWCFVIFHWSDWAMSARKKNTLLSCTGRASASFFLLSEIGLVWPRLCLFLHTRSVVNSRTF